MRQYRVFCSSKMIPCCISFSLHSYRFFSFRLSSWKLCTTQYCMSMYTLEWLDFCAILIFWPRLRDVSTYSVFAICGRARLMEKKIWSKILANWNNSQTFKLRTKESLKTFQTERISSQERTLDPGPLNLPLPIQSFVWNFDVTICSGFSIPQLL